MKLLHCQETAMQSLICLKFVLKKEYYGILSNFQATSYNIFSSGRRVLRDENSAL